MYIEWIFEFCSILHILKWIPTAAIVTGMENGITLVAAQKVTMGNETTLKDYMTKYKFSINHRVAINIWIEQHWKILSLSRLNFAVNEYLRRSTARGYIKHIYAIVTPVKWTKWRALGIHNIDEKQCVYYENGYTMRMDSMRMDIMRMDIMSVELLWEWISYS